MLTLSTTLAAALADSSIKLRLYIDLQVDASTHFYCSDGPTAGGKDTAIVNYSAFASDVDPDTRERGTGAITLEILDAWLRPLAIDYWLKGKSLKVYLGAEDIPDADYLLMFNGIIQDWGPGGNGVLSVEVHDVFSMLTTEKELEDLSSAWTGLHPLDAMWEILNSSGVPSSLLSSADFDPSLAKFTDISHLKVAGRRLLVSSAPNVSVPVSATELLDGLSRIMDGMLIADDDGKVRYRRVDTTTVDRAISNDDILSGSIEQGSDSMTGNRANYRFGHDGNHWTMIYTVDNSQSQTDMAYPGEVTRIFETDIEDRWTGSRLRLATSGGWTAVATSGSVFTQGLTATGSGTFPVAIAAHEAVSVARPAWFMVGDEVIKITAQTFDANYIHRFPAWDENGIAVDTGVDEPGLCVVTMVRAQLGTTGAAHAEGARIVDITTAKIMAERYLERKAYGLPPISFRLNMLHVDIELGDVITIDWPEFVWFGTDGLDTSYRWEVIGKEIDPHGDPPSIKITASFVKHASATRTTIANPKRTFNILGMLDKDSIKNDNGMGADVHFAESPVISGAAGLAADLLAAKLSDNEKTSEAPDTTFTFLASKDSYIFQDVITGTRRVEAVTLGGAAPEPETNEALAAKVTTDATSITATDTTAAPLRAFDGGKVLANTVEAGSISNLVERDDVLGNGDFRKYSRG